MKYGLLRDLPSWLVTLLICFGLVACGREGLRPLQGINRSLLQSASSRRQPALGKRWLATLANHQGKERIELIDLRNRSPVLLPGLNRPDAQPISVSVSANGKRLALVRQRDDQTELLLYPRSMGTVHRLELSAKGIPRHVILDGEGRLLAVQVSRDGRWDVDLIRLPS